jgi:hypothetical protein
MNVVRYKQYIAGISTYSVKVMKNKLSMAVADFRGNQV